MEWLEKHIKLFVKVLIGLVLVLVLLIFGLNMSKNDTKNTQNTGSSAAQQSPDMSKLAGFTLTWSQEGTNYIYKTTESGKNFSLSVTTNQDLLSQHQQQYPLERNDNALNGVEVAYGYNQPESINGQLVRPEFASLAFDFKLNGTNYSGEITETSDTPSKAELLEVLERFTAELN